MSQNKGIDAFPGGPKAHLHALEDAEGGGGGHAHRHHLPLVLALLPFAVCVVVGGGATGV